MKKVFDARMQSEFQKLEQAVNLTLKINKQSGEDHEPLTTKQKEYIKAYIRDLQQTKRITLHKIIKNSPSQARIMPQMLGP